MSLMCPYCREIVPEGQTACANGCAGTTLREDLQDLGWTIENTGGGCVAWMKSAGLASRRYWLVTSLEGADTLPVSWVESCMLGLYETSEDDERCLVCLEVDTVEHAVRMVQTASFG
jgi:hypothetical protein